MVETLLTPQDLGQALSMVRTDPAAAFLAGGTYLLTSQFSREKMNLISLDLVTPRSISREATKEGPFLSIGAGATFQDLLDSPIVPKQIKKACSSMVDRNIRNRATVGGNIGADKSCASLVPLFIALGSIYRCAEGMDVEAAAWHKKERVANPSALSAKAAQRLVLQVLVPLGRNIFCAFARYSRTGCDLSVLTCAVSAKKKEGLIDPESLALCLGGLGPKAERYTSLERDLAASLVDGAIPDKGTIEALARSHFSPISDTRGSAEFKRLRAGILLADALHSLEALA
ncbi:MAG: putative selenate reductase FAD-binding subunit [Spirochaetes bacterium]|nr:MAG: putative selenate reductase FAD-binding subunit [Spirochaetota bacterium]